MNISLKIVKRFLFIDELHNFNRRTAFGKKNSVKKKPFVGEEVFISMFLRFCM